MRKLFTFLIALASIAFGVCSPAFADSCSRAFGYQGGTGCNSVIAGGGGAATFVPGIAYAVVYGYGASTFTKTGMNGGTNYPSGAVVVIAAYGSDGGASTFTGPTIGGVTLTRGVGATGGTAFWYTASPLASSTTDTFVFTNANTQNWIAISGCYMTGVSATPKNAGSIQTASLTGAQYPDSSIAVASGQFGITTVIGASTQAGGTLAWDTTPHSNITGSTGDNFNWAGGTNTISIGMAHTITADAAWLPKVSATSPPLSGSAEVVDQVWGP